MDRTVRFPMQQRRACVYLLQRRDRCRFKLGWSREPLRRVRAFPEFSRRELDIDASRAIWLPGRRRAEEVERSMHKTMAPYHALTEHQREGYKEWFDGAQADRALRLMSQMPLDETSRRTARLVPLALPPALAAEAAEALERYADPLDLWSSIEDLLSRLAMQHRLTVTGQAETTVVVHGLRRGGVHVLAISDVRRAALDAESYQIRRGGRLFSFARLIAYDGDDLVVEFTPLKAIERWDEGASLVWQIKGFFARLKGMGRNEGGL